MLVKKGINVDEIIWIPLGRLANVLVLWDLDIINVVVIRVDMRLGLRTFLQGFDSCKYEISKLF